MYRDENLGSGRGAVLGGELWRIRFLPMGGVLGVPVVVFLVVARMLLAFVLVLCSSPLLLELGRAEHRLC